MAAVHDVQTVIVPVVLAVQENSADCEVLALVGDKGPFGRVPEVHSLDHYILAFTEVDEFGPFSDSVVLGCVLKKPQMNLVQEIECAVESPSVNNTLSLYGNILLTFC